MAPAVVLVLGVHAIEKAGPVAIDVSAVTMAARRALGAAGVRPSKWEAGPRVVAQAQDRLARNRQRERGRAIAGLRLAAARGDTADLAPLVGECSVVRAWASGTDDREGARFDILLRAFPGLCISSTVRPPPSLRVPFLACTTAEVPE